MERNKRFNLPSRWAVTFLMSQGKSDRSWLDWEIEQDMLPCQNFAGHTL
jgi:hypothetical protein